MTHKLLSIDVQGVANGQYLVLMNGEATVVDGGKVLPFTDTFEVVKDEAGAEGPGYYLRKKFIVLN